MNTKSIWLTAICVALGGGTVLHSSPPESPAATKVLTSLQQAVASTGKKVSPSLALVKIEKRSAESAGPKPSSGPIYIGGSSSPRTTCGIILTPEGHILAPGIFKPDQDQRLIVMLGENEFVARPAKVDESLGMTILKIEADETLHPMDLSKGADLAVGEWAVTLCPTDEDFDYQTLASPVVCQGEKAGYYRQFKLGQMGYAPSNAVVVNLSGQMVGLLGNEGVSAITDLYPDIKRLLAEAGGKSTADEDKKKKGWLGAMLTPINKDYAKAGKIPTSALRVMYVCKDSPAAKAGLREGDMIVALNGKPLRLTGNRAMEYFTKSLQPRTGEKFTITAIRDQKSADYSAEFTPEPEAETLRAEDLGVTVSSISDKDAFAMNLATDRGVLITDVTKGSPAANSGSLRQSLLSKNNIIVELAGQPTPDLASFENALETIRRDHPPVVLVKFRSGLLTGYAGLNLTLGVKDNGNKQ